MYCCSLSFRPSDITVGAPLIVGFTSFPRNSNSMSALLGANALSVPACHLKYKCTIGYFQIINVHSAGVFVPVCLGLCLLLFLFLHQIVLWCHLNRCQSGCCLLCLNDSGRIFIANLIDCWDCQHGILLQTTQPHPYEASSSNLNHSCDHRWSPDNVWVSPFVLMGQCDSKVPKVSRWFHHPQFPHQVWMLRHIWQSICPCVHACETALSLVKCCWDLPVVTEMDFLWSAFSCSPNIDTLCHSITLHGWGHGCYTSAIRTHNNPCFFGCERT